MGMGFEEGHGVGCAAGLCVGAGYGAANVEIVRKALRCGLEQLHAALRVAVVEEGLGAADGETGPEGLELIALLGGEAGAGVKALQGRVKRVVVAEIVEQPGVLHFERGRDGGAMERVIALEAVEGFGCVRRIAHSGVEAGFGLDELDVRLKLAAHVGGDLHDLIERLGVAVAGDERKDQAFPGVGGLGAGRIGGKLRGRGVVALDADLGLCGSGAQGAGSGVGCVCGLQCEGGGAKSALR